MPGGPSLKRQRHDATATTDAGQVSSAAQGSGGLPTWHGGETVLDVAMDDEVTVASGATAADEEPGPGAPVSSYEAAHS